MNISLELYKTFYYVAKNSSISKAANEMMISQPAISKSIKTLEEQLDIKLFIRKKDGVVLTEAGTLLYKKIKNVMELINSAEFDLKSLTNMDNGIINIGASKSILHYFLMPYIKEFHNKYPNIKIRIYTDKTSDLIKKTKMGLIDIIFTNLPLSVSDNFEKYNLIELHDCMVVGNKFNYLKGKKISTKELESLPLILLTKGATSRNAFDSYCAQNNITPTIEMELGSNSLIKEFCEAGFGIGMVTKEYVKEELSFNKLWELNLEKKLPKKSLGMIYIKDNISYASTKFIEYLKDSLK